MDATEAVARECIRDLVARYAHAADRGRSDEVAGLFVEAGVLALPDGHELVGPAAIRAFLDATAAAMRAAPAQGRVRHHVASHRILVDGPDAARGFAYFLVVTERGPDHWGRYADRYARTAAGWRFAERRVRLDGAAPGSATGTRPG